MDLNYKQQVTVGALVIGAVAVFIAGTLWLSGKKIGGQGDLTTIEFPQVGNLKEGSPVFISGVNKGKVAQIRLLEPGKVHVMVSLAKDVTARSDASAKIISISALGEAAVDFNPGSSATPLARTGVIQGTTAPAISDRLASLGDRADSVLLGAQELVGRRTADDLHTTMLAMQRMLNTISERLPAPTEEATRTMAVMRRLSERLDSTLANPGLSAGLTNLDSVTGNLSRMTSQLSHTSATLDTLLGNINSGRGTLGKFAADSGLYTDLRATLQSMKALIDDIQRNPGRITVQLKVF
ncbi:MAG TPA: MlaD family protein [Gemmatimonadales bacterium]|jgi:phospholipid/cholesterol/gamma-HCH transport system substrate-binding protein|nr:MlaD family protein [Gemmatimonadales bacterium]